MNKEQYKNVLKQLKGLKIKVKPKHVKTYTINGVKHNRIEYKGITVDLGEYTLVANGSLVQKPSGSIKIMNIIIDLFESINDDSKNINKGQLMELQKVVAVNTKI